jgi:hypothetical protein
MSNVLTIGILLVASASTVVSSTSSVMASDSKSGEQQVYILQIAEQIAAGIDSGVAGMTFEDLSNLSLLTTQSDADAIAQQQSNPDSFVLDQHENAEHSLAAHFANEFKQSDNIDFPSYNSSIPIKGTRDVYTFCPAGADVQRPLTESTMMMSGKPEYLWTWSHCSSGAAVRIQKMWVSNEKIGHPILTLSFVEDGWEAGEPDKKPRLDLDLNQLVAGKFQAAEVTNALK